ncbi:glycoside hydrolase family 172 protein [Antarcticibacterium sp. 1MA-6-2]|uniref:glycoside hydrolase family 172 protein n=1 Tax=Antarcticibacterium sp. 1MA-6-2 TaxID=2908210 RepID=UPI0021082EEE|nr:glycoside hydrolase family 172 protein [Antarcticibacterium sp. 1MA-6-2]
MPFIEYFKPTIPAFNFPQLVYETNARGFNNYVPITYQKSLKIVADPGWGQYYHFNYISFPKGIQVEKFDPEMSENNLKALQEVNNLFESRMGEYPYDLSVTTENKILRIAPGEEKIFFQTEDAGAVSSLKVKLKIGDKKKMAEILRKLLLTIKWDGEEEPSVWSPLGDFFGTSPGWNEYRTFPMGMTEEWMYSYWYMPFKDGAEIAVKNDFNEEVQIEIELKHEELGVEVEDLARFHAKWHRDLSPLEESRWPDWTLLETMGKGRFVGTHLLVWNPKGGSCSAAGPGHHWWGEGDEKFFVDGETFPSTFGTGTEDYFGYAWCDPSKFEHAFHSQTQDNDNMGYQPMN